MAILPVFTAVLLLTIGEGGASSRPGILRHPVYRVVAEADLDWVDDIRVHREAVAPLRRLLAAAREEGVSLRAATGYRSMAEQARVFEEGRRRKGLAAADYAYWTAPPGRSEHQTGLAVDFTDPGCPEADFNPARFGQTPAGRWLLQRAPAFGFRLTFPPGNSRRVAYEPWHWAYAGTREARGLLAPLDEGR